MSTVPPFKIHVTVENEAKDKAVRIPVEWDGEQYKVSPTFEPSINADDFKDDPVGSLYLKYAEDIIDLLMRD